MIGIVELIKIINMKKKKASALIYIIFLLTALLAFCAFAVDGTIILMIREKLQSATEATALAAASNFNCNASVTQGDIAGKASEVFNILKTDNLQSANMTATVNLSTKEVLITTQMPAQTYFLSFLGVSNVSLNAKARAKSENLPITANYLNVNWLTASAAYFSDIISKDLNLNDTAILLPIGNYPSASYDTSTNLVNFNLIDSGDTQPLSLGPGGFITIKLPNPIIDKPGNDLLVTEIGSPEGYMVFAGLDVNPEKPYVQYDKPGDGIKWVNISCSGTPSGTGIGTGIAQGTSFGAQISFYGSGNFDLGAPCLAAKELSMAKYIRIIDDNTEDGYLSGAFVKFYGEASTAVAGADIDSVTVLNSVRLLSPSGFVP